MAFADEMSAIIRSSAQAGLDAAAAFLRDRVREEAPGQQLKANIDFFRDELSAIIGPINEPLAPWWRIAEFGGWIRAKRWFPYVASIRATTGPLLWIPFQKGSGGGFIPTIKLLRRGSSRGVALAYDPGSKQIGGPVAALAPEVYYKPHEGRGYLNFVIEQNMDAAMARFSDAMQAAIDGKA